MNRKTTVQIYRDFFRLAMLFTRGDKDEAYLYRMLIRRDFRRGIAYKDPAHMEALINSAAGNFYNILSEVVKNEPRLIDDRVRGWMSYYRPTQ